jgi:hypothetical protein
MLTNLFSYVIRFQNHHGHGNHFLHERLSSEVFQASWPNQEADSLRRRVLGPLTAGTSLRQSTSSFLDQCICFPGVAQFYSFTVHNLCRIDPVTMPDW